MQLSHKLSQNYIYIELNLSRIVFIIFKDKDDLKKLRLRKLKLSIFTLIQNIHQLPAMSKLFGD